MTTRAGRIACAIALVVGAALSGACGPISSVSCSTELRVSFSVHVVDAHTNAGICNATMTWNDGSQTMTYDCDGPPECGYCSGPMEQMGTFHVTVTKPGYQKAETTIVVPGEQCHVITQNVTVHLWPQ